MPTSVSRALWTRDMAMFSKRSLDFFFNMGGRGISEWEERVERSSLTSLSLSIDTGRDEDPDDDVCDGGGT